MVKSFSKWQGFVGRCCDSFTIDLIFCVDNQCFNCFVLLWVLHLMTGKYEILLK